METQYIKNTKTGLVFEANEHLLDYAASQSHLILVDEHGNKVDGESSDGDAALKQENDRLRQQIHELEAELQLYRNPQPPTANQDETAAPDEQPEPNRMDQIVRAIGELETGNPDHFTQGGIPRVEALEAFAQIPEVTASERDEAWTRFNNG